MKLLPTVIYVTHRDTGAWNEDLRKIHNENTAKEILSMHISEFGLRVENMKLFSAPSVLLLHLLIHLCIT